MAEMSQALARVRREPFADLPVAGHVHELLEKAGHVWRERLLGPLVMLRLLVIRILGGTCAISALRQRAGIDFSPASFCEARSRLPLPLLQSLLQWLREQAERSMGAAAKWIGPRVLIADGSTYSMPDAPALRAHFDLPPGQEQGVGYPMGKLMGLLDAATGLFTRLLALPLFRHDMRSVMSVHPEPQKGDILLGDRALCSFAHLALLNARGVFGCFRLHQRRKNLSPGMQRWKKPSKAPAWMTAAQFALLPASLEVRLVCHAPAKKKGSARCGSGSPPPWPTGNSGPTPRSPRCTASAGRSRRASIT